MTDETGDGSGPTPTTTAADCGGSAAVVEPAAPDEFGRVQAWWGDGKGKTTAALGMGMRAAGHGYRVHLLQFMKGGAGSVEDARGEYDAIAALPGFTYETVGHRGWHGALDASDDGAHAARARAALSRARDLLDGADAADLTAPLRPDGDPTDGVHMLILDELLYAVERGLVPERDVLDLARSKPARLELVVTGSHARPTYLLDATDLVSEVRKVKHPFDAGQAARKGTEY